MNRTYFNPQGTIDVEVRDDTGRTFALKHIVQHSPTGMTWGYYGSGPHDLALSILADYFEATGVKPSDALDKAAHYHHMFTVDFVAEFKDAWEITAGTIEAWLSTKPERIVD